MAMIRKARAFKRGGSDLPFPVVPILHLIPVIPAEPFQS
jgi:hypothetical protein